MKMRCVDGDGGLWFEGLQGEEEGEERGDDVDDDDDDEVHDTNLFRTVCFTSVVLRFP
jgi:hypothetical protein